MFFHLGFDVLDGCCLMVFCFLFFVLVDVLGVCFLGVLLFFLG